MKMYLFAEITLHPTHMLLSTHEISWYLENFWANWNFLIDVSLDIYLNTSWHFKIRAEPEATRLQRPGFAYYSNTM